MVLIIHLHDKHSTETFVVILSCKSLLKYSILKYTGFVPCLGVSIIGGFMTQQNFTPEITDDFVKMHKEYLVPAIYAQWANRVAEIAEIDLGHHVLDVACGTGSLARAARIETGFQGKVTGLDSSEKMLESAAQQSRGIEWQHGDAESMPFKKNQFDRVICQFSLMFITNRVHAIKEMLRVCKTDGRVVLSTWAQLEHSRAYGILIDLVRQYAGAHAAFKLAAPWALCKPGVMDALLLTTGVNEYECHERRGVAHFPSMKSFVETHLRLVGEFDKLDEDTYQGLLSAAAVELAPFMVADGKVAAQLDAHVFVVSGI